APPKTVLTFRVHARSRVKNARAATDVPRSGVKSKPCNGLCNPFRAHPRTAQQEGAQQATRAPIAGRVRVKTTRFPPKNYRRVAALRRSCTRARPSRASVSNKPGLTDLPATATLVA